MYLICIALVGLNGVGVDGQAEMCMGRCMGGGGLGDVVGVG